jgi:hypothetical protein
VASPSGRGYLHGDRGGGGLGGGGPGHRRRWSGRAGGSAGSMGLSPPFGSAGGGRSPWDRFGGGGSPTLYGGGAGGAGGAGGGSLPDGLQLLPETVFNSGGGGGGSGDGDSVSLVAAMSELAATELLAEAATLMLLRCPYTGE